MRGEGGRNRIIEARAIFNLERRGGEVVYRLIERSSTGEGRVQRGVGDDVDGELMFFPLNGF